ncbi:Transmembrane protein 186 [Schistosoma japonicum]|nr:Transmembrane protein 186 [Schistosoma japonicum]
MKIPLIFDRVHKLTSYSSLIIRSSLIQKKVPKCSTSCFRISLLHSGRKAKSLDDKEDLWVPLYRLHSIVIIQVISRFKLILTGLLIFGCPVAIYKCLHDQFSSSSVYKLLGCATFSLCGLIIFSWFSTKIAGVVSIHKVSGLIRIGHLTFLGRRQNTIFNTDQIIPPSDLGDAPERNNFVRIGITEADFDSTKNSVIKHNFIFSKVWSEILDRKKFEQIFGFTW